MDATLEVLHHGHENLVNRVAVPICRVWSGGLRKGIGGGLGSPDQPSAGVSLGLSATLVWSQNRRTLRLRRGRYRWPVVDVAAGHSGSPKRDPKRKRLHPAF